MSEKESVQSLFDKEYGEPPENIGDITEAPEKGISDESFNHLMQDIDEKTDNYFEDPAIQERIDQDQTAIDILREKIRELEKTIDEGSMDPTSKLPDLTNPYTQREIRGFVSVLSQEEMPKPSAVVKIDLDGLRPANDLYGEEGGDALIAAFGKAITMSTRAEDFAAREGRKGDEFVLVLRDVSQDEAVKVLSKIGENFKTVLEGFTEDSAEEEFGVDPELVRRIKKDFGVSPEDVAFFSAGATFLEYEDIESSDTRDGLREGQKRVYENFDNAAKRAAPYYKVAKDFGGNRVVFAEDSKHSYAIRSGEEAPERLAYKKIGQQARAGIKQSTSGGNFMSKIMKLFR